MPLPFEECEPFAIPDSAWVKDIATVIVHGGSYGGGYWTLAASVLASGDPVGEIRCTEPANKQPELAVDTALTWVNDACVRTGLKFMAYQNLNDQLDRESAPYCAAAMFFIDRAKEPAGDLA